MNNISLIGRISDAGGVLENVGITKLLHFTMLCDAAVGSKNGFGRFDIIPVEIVNPSDEIVKFIVCTGSGCGFQVEVIGELVTTGYRRVVSFDSPKVVLPKTVRPMRVNDIARAWGKGRENWR